MQNVAKPEVPAVLMDPYHRDPAAVPPLGRFSFQRDDFNLVANDKIPYSTRRFFLNNPSRLVSVEEP